MQRLTYDHTLPTLRSCITQVVGGVVAVVVAVAAAASLLFRSLPTRFLVSCGAARVRPRGRPDAASAQAEVAPRRAGLRSPTPLHEVRPPRSPHSPAQPSNPRGLDGLPQHQAALKRVIA